MNDTLKTIMNRKSVRKFSDKAISPEDILLLIGIPYHMSARKEAIL